MTHSWESSKLLAQINLCAVCYSKLLVISFLLGFNIIPQIPCPLGKWLIFLHTHSLVIYSQTLLVSWILCIVFARKYQLIFWRENLFHSGLHSNLGSFVSRTLDSPAGHLYRTWKSNIFKFQFLRNFLMFRLFPIQYHFALKFSIDLFIEQLDLSYTFIHISRYNKDCIWEAINQDIRVVFSNQVGR